MINAIINGIWNMVQGLINLVLSPIDLLLGNIPGINTALDGVRDFIVIAKNAMAWALDIIPTGTRQALLSVMLAIAFFWQATYAVKLIKITYGWLQKIKFW